MSNSDMVKFVDLEKRVEVLEAAVRRISAALEALEPIVSALEPVVEGLVDKVHGKVVHDEVLGQPADVKKREQLRNTLEQSRGPSASRPG